MKWLRVLGGAAVLALLVGCSVEDSVESAPGFGGINGPPDQPPPTGSKWQGVEMEGSCGRLGLGWILVDEVCGGTDDPAYLDAFRAPMFRDGVELAGLLYVVDATHLWVLDVSDHGDIRREALISGFGEPLSMAEHGGKLLIAAGSEGLLTVDVSQPFEPAREAQVQLPGPALDVAVDGEIAYVTTGHAGVAMIDLGQSPPALLKVIPVGGFSAGVTAREGLAYVAACGRLVVVDVDTGVELSEIWVPEPFDGDVLVAPAKDVDLIGDVAFVAAGRYGAVAVDVAVPSSPALLGNCTIAGDLSFYASGVRHQGDQLFIAGGEWGVMPISVSDPAAACSSFITPSLPPLPDGDGDGECSTEAPWDVVPWQQLWAPPPPAQDPIQTLPRDGFIYAFGDARRVGLRAVDVRDSQDSTLPKIGRYDEPRLITAIAAGQDRVLLVGEAGGLFERDEVELLKPSTQQLPEAKLGMAGLVLDDGRPVIATAAGEIFIDGQLAAFVLGDIWPGSLAAGADTIVVPYRDGAQILSATNGTTSWTVLTDRQAELPQAVAVLGDEIYLAAPEWTDAVRAHGFSPDPLPPHGVFDDDEIMNPNLWMAGLPRRLLLSSSAGLVEVAGLAEHTGLSLHQDGASTSLSLPNGTYVGGCAQGSRVYLVATDRGRYVSQLVTVELAGGLGVVGMTSFTGVAVGAAADGDRLYLADADRGVRIYDLSTGSAQPLGVVQLEVTP